MFHANSRTFTTGIALRINQTLLKVCIRTDGVEMQRRIGM